MTTPESVPGGSSAGATLPARLCVYCGSNAGNSPSFAAAARHLGAAMARRSIGLVYGGGHVGLMGTVADAVLEHGGDVVGVITQQLVKAETAHIGLSRLETVGSMHERKARMAELSDGFIVLPGGFGTMDELAEMLTWNQLGLVHKPVVLLDVDGFWTPLYQWIDGAIAAGFVRDSHRMLAQRAHSIDEAIALALSSAPAVGHKWVDRDTVGPITRDIPRITAP
jgi:uncharacterized protein (TIGR00730 family)